MKQVPDEIKELNARARQTEIAVPEGEIGEYNEYTLDFFKAAITTQCKIFVRGRRRKPSAVICGQNQLKMLRQDKTARWMLNGLELIISPDLSRLQFK